MHRVLLVAAAWLAAAATAQHHYGPVPTDRCDAAMAAACGDLQGGEATCHACAGTHAATIRSAGCAPSDIDGFCTRGIDPRYKRNITVYHINPSTFGDVPVTVSVAGISKSGCDWLLSMRMVVVLPTKSSGWDWKQSSVGSVPFGQRRYE